MENNSMKVNNSEESSSEAAKADPPFIRYMLALSNENRRVFLVGNPSSEQPPEEITVCTDLLMAHSEVFRLMLEVSPLAEKKVINVTDIRPDTFKDFLRFVYGYNSFSSMPLEEAVDLLYVAEKYFVKELKDKLITYISPLISIGNVCNMLQKPECLEQKVLKDIITEIVQDYTDILLSQDTFLDLNMCGILTILQQDALAVPEIQLWRAVLRWANHNEKNKVGITVHQLMRGGALENLRLCTLDLVDFCKEVCPTMILTDQEILLIFQSISTNKVLESLKTVCNTIKIRDLTSKHLHEATFSFNEDLSCVNKNDSSLTIYTHSAHMLLISASFESVKHSVFGSNAPEGVKMQCECSITVDRLYDYKTNSSVKEPQVEFVFKKNVDYGKEFEISFISSGHFIKLLSCSKYKLNFKFVYVANCTMKFYFTKNPKIDSNGNMIVTSSTAYTHTNEEGSIIYLEGSIIKKLSYKCG